jgi:hypothetical protein
VFVVVTRLGISAGKAGTPQAALSEGAGRILGAVIDSKKADEIIAAFGKVAGELAQNTDATKELGQIIRANKSASISVGGDITDARTDIRELGREIVKMGARMN